jgi:hypothetical protein
MTFFYDLNKKLDTIREKPELTHGQLNERDMSRAAKGYEKYGKEGMEALAKAGREGKALDPVRKKYNKYDESMEEGIVGDTVKKVGGMVKKAGSAVLNKLGHGSDEDMIRDLQKKAGVPQTGKKPGTAPAQAPMDPKDEYDYLTGRDKVRGGEQQVKEKMSPAKAKSFAALAEPKDKITFADKIAGAKKEVDEMLGDVAAEAMKAALSPKQKKIDMNKNGKLDANDFAMLRKGGKKQVADENTDPRAEDRALVQKARKILPKYHARMEPEDAYETVADLLGIDIMRLYDLLGDESLDEGWDDMLKDVEKRRTARKVGDVTHGAKHDTEEIPGGRRVTRRTDPNTGYSVGADDDSESSGEKRGRGRPKGSKKAMGAKGPSGKSKLMTKEEGGDEGSDLVKLSKVIASCTTKEQLETARKMAQNFLSKYSSGQIGTLGGHLRRDIGRRNDVVATVQQKNKELSGEKELDEKAVSKKQQRFMGMVHATQKGEKAPSKEVAKVAKSMGKKDAEDFAATKHKGLPEKKKPEDKKDSKSEAPKKKKEKTEEAGGTGTPTASSGFGFGKGIYDSLDRDVEAMIAESMNISMNANSDGANGPSKSLTVTATDDDALKLSELLKNAGLGGSGDAEGYGGEGYKSACGCGTPDCSCGSEEMDEAYGDNAVSQNKPNWPTNTEQAEDNFEYAGGLNKPKSTGQTTVPVIASQEERQESYAEAEEDAIKRMMEMAGVKKKEVDEEKTEEGNLFTGNLAKARAAGKTEADLDGDGKMEKVDEGILSATANLWTEYKGKYGV